MKADREKYIVYKIYQTSDDKVVYVGVTKNMYNRWKNHIDKTGKFNNKDYYFRQIKIYKIKKYARKYEEKLQIKYNLQTDISKIHIHAQKGRIAAQEIVICPHCGKSGKRLSQTRYHFDKCKVISIIR